MSSEKVNTAKQNPNKIILEDTRCSYVFAAVPRDETDDDGNKTGKKKFSVQPLIPKNSKNVKRMRAIIKRVAEEKFGVGVKMGSLKTPLRDGDEEREGKEYEGMYFMNANASKKPGIVNRQGDPADETDIEELCFSGAYFHVSVSFFAFKKKGSKGVAVGLNNIMLRKKGERLDGGVAATDEFADYADEDGGFDDDDDTGDDW